MTEALAGFENYIEYLATGKLDVHLDSIKCEDKVTDLKVVLPLHPILLLHELGKHGDQERIEGLFKRDRFDRCDTVFVVPG
jgi:cell division protein ZapA (FtsZ GTPase activity inhibitor)